MKSINLSSVHKNFVHTIVFRTILPTDLLYDIMCVSVDTCINLPAAYDQNKVMRSIKQLGQQERLSGPDENNNTEQKTINRV